MFQHLLHLQKTLLIWLSWLSLFTKFLNWVTSVINNIQKSSWEQKRWDLNLFLFRAAISRDGLSLYLSFADLMIHLGPTRNSICSQKNIYYVLFLLLVPLPSFQELYENIYENFLPLIQFPRHANWLLCLPLALSGGNTCQSWGRSLSLGFMSLGSQLLNSKNMRQINKKAKTKQKESKRRKEVTFINQHSLL